MQFFVKPRFALQNSQVSHQYLKRFCGGGKRLAVVSFKLTLKATIAEYLQSTQSMLEFLHLKTCVAKREVRRSLDQGFSTRALSPPLGATEQFPPGPQAEAFTK